MSDSTRGLNPTPQNPQQIPWGAGPRPTLDPQALNNAIPVINNPVAPATQPSAPMEAIKGILGKH